MYDKIYSLKMHISVMFSIFKVLCNQYHYLISSPKKKPNTQEAITPCLHPPPALAATVFTDLSILKISYKWNHKIHGHLCLASCI